MQKTKLIFLPFSFVFVISGCTTLYQPQGVQYRDYQISGAHKDDEKLVALIKPYSDSVHKSMNDVIAVTEITLEKKQPEGTLGNLMADIMLAEAKQII